jgi:hypothetical protein
MYFLLGFNVLASGWESSQTGQQLGGVVTELMMLRICSSVGTTVSGFQPAALLRGDA